jgi:integrase
MRRYLKKHDLLNDKYLTKRNNIYYFVFYLEKDLNCQYSLKTSNYLIANIFKYKILYNIMIEMRKMNIEDRLNTNQALTIFKSDNSLNLIAEDEEEKVIIESITKKTINSVKRRKVKRITSNIDLKTSRSSKNNIRKHIELYIRFLKSTKKSEKTIHGYIKKYEILIDYFNYIKVFNLIDITKQDCKELQEYLLQFPSNINKFQELKDKNIFELINLNKENHPILKTYKKLDLRTVDNYITRYKTLFNYFLDKDYVYSNYFLTIKNLKVKIENPITVFEKKEDIRIQFDKLEIELLLEKIEDKEIKDLIVLGVITGARINEILNLKIEDILVTKIGYFFDIKKSKTRNGIRVIPVHKRFEFLVKDLLEDKKEEDFLLFNDITGNRLDKIQKRTMYQIRKYIKNKNKVFHSFRKNFSQELYKSNIEELYIKLLLGHTLKDNLSFNTYNLSKIDNEVLQAQINKIDFKSLFEDTEYNINKIKNNTDTNLIESVKNSQKIELNM